MAKRIMLLTIIGLFVFSGSALASIASHAVPSYIGSSVVTDPTLESFRHYDLLFVFSAKTEDLQSALSGTDWIAEDPPILTLSWDF